MATDWCATWTLLGTTLVACCVAESAWQTCNHGFERALHLHLALGTSKGLATFQILLVVVAQTLSVLGLFVPAVYLRTGVVVPGVLLTTTVWSETLLFGDSGDATTVLRSVSLTVACLTLTLFRYDRHARSLQHQVPTSGPMLHVESIVRRVCTRARTGLAMPPLAIVTLAWSTTQNPYWRAHGVLSEWYRGRFQACAAAASVLFLAAGQDARASVQVHDAWLSVSRWLVRYRSPVEHDVAAPPSPAKRRWLGSLVSFTAHEQPRGEPHGFAWTRSFRAYEWGDKKKI